MPNKSKEDLVQQLVKSYHTLLDEALIVAIAGDHDLTKPSEYQTAKATLDGLSQHVPAEEASGFNPSGVLEFGESSSHSTAESFKTATTSVPESQSRLHATDSSSTISYTPSEPQKQNTAVTLLTAFNNDSEDGKIQELQTMFPELKPYDVSYALKKAAGNFQAALDDLLNVQYLQATGQQRKGLDGFFNEGQSPNSPGKRRKRKKNKSANANSQTEDALLSSYVKEAKEQSEIGHLAERFNLTFDEVSQIFYDNSCSSGATAIVILDQYISEKPLLLDSASNETKVATLGRKYRHVSEKYLHCIISATNNIEPFADDVAALVEKHLAKRPKGQRLNLENRLTPLPHDDIEGSTTTASPSKKLPSSSSLPILPSGVTAHSSVDFAQAIQMSGTLHQAKRDAIGSASQMYKRGASNPLYRQAAGFYADRARETSRQAHHMTSTAADLLVNQQSRPNEIDLHGVIVQDGVRIARQKALNWWENLGDTKSRKARERPLTIITGIGRHSAGGVSQLRKAVAAALLQDGWQVEIGTGKFTLTGRR